VGDFKTFWDIEQEKTWRIYILFGILLLFYFVPIFFIWMIIKFIIYARQSLNHPGMTFRVFDFDTVIVLICAGVVTAIHWYHSNKTVVQRVLRLLNAQVPDKNDRYHHMFQNIVDEMGTAAGGIQIEPHVIPTGAMNAFALADLEGRNVIGVTEGLLSRLSREELQAVTAHETAHIVSNDCLQTTVICSLFSIYSEALAQLNRAIVHGEPQPSPFFGEVQRQNAVAASIVAVPIVFFLFVTDCAGQFLNMFISREKEYRADASAVKFTRNPLSLAAALYKIGTHWRGAGFGGEYLSPIFIFSPEHRQLEEQEGVLATLFSTHPPLNKRLRIVLKLGHADMHDIREQLQRRRGLKTAGEEEKTTPSFYVEKKGTWHGPYTLQQLQAVEWLQPDTRLRTREGADVSSAAEMPVLSVFFERRKEPIAKIRRLCPDCREWLVLQEYEGLYVWKCAFCNGLLVEGDKLPRIFVRKEKGFNQRVRRFAEVLHASALTRNTILALRINVPHLRPCPKCGKPMVHKFYSYAYHVEVDVCPLCDLTWFDVDELETLQCLIELEELAS
jgi:heat shock protein HtpX